MDNMETWIKNNAPPRFKYSFSCVQNDDGVFTLCMRLREGDVDEANQWLQDQHRIQRWTVPVKAQLNEVTCVSDLCEILPPPLFRLGRIYYVSKCLK